MSQHLYLLVPAYSASRINSDVGASRWHVPSCSNTTEEAVALAGEDVEVAREIAAGLSSIGAEVVA
jgi:hypothetical protein